MKMTVHAAPKDTHVMWEEHAKWEIVLFQGQRNLQPNPWSRILFVLEKSPLAQMAPPVAQLLGGHMDVVLCPRYFIFLVCFNDKFIEGTQ